VCWPSIKGIADKCNVSENTVRTAIKLFEDDGTIKVTRGRGRHNTNRYLLVVENLQLERENPQLGGRKPPAATAPEPSYIEPSEENIYIQKPSSDKTPRLNARRFVAIWKDHFGGILPIVKHAAALKRLVAEYGDDVLFSAFELYCKKTHPEWASLARFIQIAGAYVKEVQGTGNKQNEINQWEEIGNDVPTQGESGGDK